MAFDVRAWRHQLGLYQREAATRLGCTEREVRRWEAGQITPPYYMVAKMVRLGNDRIAGVSTEPAATAPPTVRRKLPRPSVRTGRPETIDIAPSSF